MNNIEKINESLRKLFDSEEAFNVGVNIRRFSSGTLFVFESTKPLDGTKYHVKIEAVMGGGRCGVFIEYIKFFEKGIFGRRIKIEKGTYEIQLFQWIENELAKVVELMYDEAKRLKIAKLNDRLEI